MNLEEKAQSIGWIGNFQFPLKLRHLYTGQILEGQEAIKFLLNLDTNDDTGIRDGGYIPMDKEDFKDDSFDKIWEKIKEEFDFVKVAHVMKMLRWEWDIDRTGVLRVPDKDEIVHKAYKLSKEAYYEKTIIDSGGFICDCCDGNVNISFYVDSLYIHKDEL